MRDLRLTLTVPETGRTVRVFGTADSPAWVAADVALALGLRNVHSTLALMPEDEKGLHNVDTPGGPQAVVTVTEAGLFRLILKSRRPEAVALKTWLVRDVLPSIRRFGCYPPPAAVAPVEAPVEGQSPARAALALAQAVVALEDRLNDQGQRLARIEARVAVAETDLQLLPAPAAVAPPLTSRAKLGARVRQYVRATASGDDGYSAAWRRLYAELRMRCGFDAVRRAENSGRAPLDVIEEAGYMDTFDAIAAEVLRAPLRLVTA